MLIIPVIPNRADAAEVFDADKIYEKIFILNLPQPIKPSRVLGK